MDSTQCAYRFKLRAIDRIRIFSNSIHTVFGTLMHNCVQRRLLNEFEDLNATARYFQRAWRKFAGLYRKHLDFAQVKQFLAAGHNIIRHIDEAFEGYAIIASEQEINTPIADTNINYKGFIDLLMMHGDRHVIMDLKTAKTTCSFKNYMTPIKRAQLAYYRKYFAQQFEMPEADIDLYFMVLEKDPSAKAPIQLIPVKFTDKKLEKAQGFLNEALGMIERNDFPKNRNECYNEYTGIRCTFFETPYCT